jgi:uncharacterized protein
MLKLCLLPTAYCLLLRTGMISLICLFISSTGYSQKAVPELWGQRIHDEAKVLSPATVDQLEVKLKNYEDSTSNQIAVLIIPSLAGDVLEEYSLRVVEKWKLGTNKNDNGVLLLIVIDDHKMRIEVGHGLEGVLTDAQSSRIIRNEMAPNFRRGNYDAGVTAAVQAIILAIGGEYNADDSGTGTTAELGLKERILIGLFVFGILGVFTFIALFSQGCAGWGLYAFLIPFYATFPLFILGIVGGVVLLALYIIGMPIAKLILGRSAWGKAKMMKWQSKGGRTGSGWSMGSGWGSSGGGGSSFSGGGGSFGGGGSSGSW